MGGRTYGGCTDQGNWPSFYPREPEQQSHRDPSSKSLDPVCFNPAASSTVSSPPSDSGDAGSAQAPHAGDTQDIAKGQQGATGRQAPCPHLVDGEGGPPRGERRCPRSLHQTWAETPGKCPPACPDHRANALPERPQRAGSRAATAGPTAACPLTATAENTPAIGEGSNRRDSHGARSYRSSPPRHPTAPILPGDRDRPRGAPGPGPRPASGPSLSPAHPGARRACVIPKRWQMSPLMSRKQGGAPVGRVRHPRALCFAGKRIRGSLLRRPVEATGPQTQLVAPSPKTHFIGL
ncbi:serine/arginine repetitive matrix protein 3-like [Alligator mississippiensis]|uniref:serine/arginine repetitive matrix protein 3-like n=1 Tax=Alligator mississippiensis TaxID=8496 RepID=UPI0028780250|nr:serine/arginine repetitive matrix protein 3-like [Alligator mississippiensis]